MTKIAIVPNAAGTGTFTIEAPNSNSNRTLTLPDAAGTVMTDATTLLTSQLPAQLSVSSSAAAGSFAVDASGRVTMPNQPSFFAYRSAVGDITYSANQVVSADMTSTRFNVGNHYNTSNGRFTAPIAGLYFFSANIYNNSASAGFRVSVAINGGAIFGRGAAAVANQFTTAGVIKLGAGDFADVRSDFDNTVVFHDISHTTFSGYLIG
jgi:hypothetical protein